MWEDLLLDRQVPDPALVEAIAALFSIPTEAVSLVGGIDEAPAVVGEGIRALIVRAPAAGDFPLQVTVYLRDDDLERRVRGRPARLGLVKQFATLLDCSALVGDETPDPLTWLLFSPSGAVKPVTLDAHRLEHDEYVVASAARAERRVETVA